MTDFKVRRETTPTGSDATPHPHGIRKDGGGEHDTWDGTGTASTDEGRDEGDGRVRRRRARGAGPNDSRAFPDFRSAVGFLSGRRSSSQVTAQVPVPLGAPTQISRHQSSHAKRPVPLCILKSFLFFAYCKPSTPTSISVQGNLALVTTLSQLV